MNKHLKLVLAVVLAVLLLFAAGCGSGEETTPSAEPPGESSAPEEKSDAGSTGGPYTIGISVADMDNAHWLRVAEGIRSEVRPEDEYIVYNAEQDPGKQVSQLEDLIAQGCDLIFYTCADRMAVSKPLEKCVELGIVCIAIDAAPDQLDLLDAYITTDNFECGVQQANTLIELSGGNAKVGLLTYFENNATKTRTEGFKATIEKVPGIEIVNENNC
ncbi:MAG: substrate-binding domain-containing protein, partial [Christensenellales bacterium]